MNDIKLANKDVIKGGSLPLIIYINPSSNSVVNGKTNVIITENGLNSVGRTSGDYEQTNAGRIIKISLVKKINGYAYGYVLESRVKLIDSQNNASAEKYATEMMGNLVKNDISVNKNLLVAAELLDRAKKNNLNTTALQSKFNTIKDQYNKRQEKIKTSKLVSVKEWINDKWEWIKSKFSSDDKKVGSVSLAIATAVGAIVAVGATALIYYTFKPDYDDSVVNLKDSELLQKAVANLQPEEAKQLKANLENQIDEAYNQGKVDQSFTGFFGNIKTLAILGIVAFGVYKFSNSKK